MSSDSEKITELTERLMANLPSVRWVEPPKSSFDREKYEREMQLIATLTERLMANYTQRPLGRAT